MSLGQMLAAELKHEAIATRKMLERVPADSFEWHPHDKSMSLGRLASHVAEVPLYGGAILTQDEFDIAAVDYKPSTLSNGNELAETFDKAVAGTAELLNNISDEDLMKTWRFRKGEQVFFELPRAAVIRTMVLSHLIHHRGQLSVYLRLNDVPLPSVYGPTADEPLDFLADAANKS